MKRVVFSICLFVAAMLCGCASPELLVTPDTDATYTWNGTVSEVHEMGDLTVVSVRKEVGSSDIIWAVGKEKFAVDDVVTVRRHRIQTAKDRSGDMIYAATKFQSKTAEAVEEKE